MSDPPKIFLQMIRRLGNHSLVYEKQGSVSQVQEWLVGVYRGGLSGKSLSRHPPDWKRAFPPAGPGSAYFCEAHPAQTRRCPKSAQWYAEAFEGGMGIAGRGLRAYYQEGWRIRIHAALPRRTPLHSSS